MTELLEKAFQEATKLPKEEQDAFARWILAELSAEERWHKTFKRSSDALAKLADEALAEHRAGETQAWDPDRW